MSKLLDIHFFFEFLLHFYTHYRNIILLFPVVFSIEGAVGDGFHQVLGKDIRFVGDVCDGEGYFSDAVVVGNLMEQSRNFVLYPNSL